MHHHIHHFQPCEVYDALPLVSPSSLIPPPTTVVVHDTAMNHSLTLYPRCLRAMSQQHDDPSVGGLRYLHECSRGEPAADARLQHSTHSFESNVLVPSVPSNESR